MLTWNSGTLRSSKLFGKQNITCHKSGYFCWKLESGQQICPSWKGGFQPAQDTDFNGRIGRCWTSSKPRLSIPVSRILSSGRLGDLSNISVRLRLKWAMGQYYLFTAHIRPCLILEPDVFWGTDVTHCWELTARRCGSYQSQWIAAIRYVENENLVSNTMKINGVAIFGIDKSYQ